MLLPKPEDALHRVQLYRLLAAIIDEPLLARSVFFKGGTCAVMLGFLDRFSIDLDFDLKTGSNKTVLNHLLMKIFDRLGFVDCQKSPESLFYVLKYESQKGLRNNLKLSIIDKALRSNQYAPCYLADIDRYAICQTKETMFANKLVAITDRYKKSGAIAGRDIYDIHYFFLQGLHYREEVIRERTGLSPEIYFQELRQFIDDKITDKVISEDLNSFLPPDRFRLIRAVLKKEVLQFLNNTGSDPFRVGPF